MGVASVHSGRSTLAYLLPLIIIADALVTCAAVYKAPYPAQVPLGSPAAYLNIYIHVPAAMATYVLYTGALVSAVLYLWRRGPRFDRYTFSFVVVATIYAAYTLISGSLWAAESWGSPWNWDPRETGVLLLFIVYLVYFALRSSISDPDRAPVVSAVYAVTAYSMVPISYLAPRIAGSSLHPTKALLQGFMKQPPVMAFFYTKVLLVTLIGVLSVHIIASCKLQGRLRTALKASAAVAALALFAAAAYAAAQYAGGSVHRVYAVFNEGETAKLLIKVGEGYRNVTVKNVPRQALGGHIIKLVGVSDGVAETVEVLLPFCVIANTILYGLAVLALTATVLYLGKRLGEGGEG